MTTRQFPLRKRHWTGIRHFPVAIIESDIQGNVLIEETAELRGSTEFATEKTCRYGTVGAGRGVVPEER
jgi:hypothetical protein